MLRGELRRLVLGDERVDLGAGERGRVDRAAGEARLRAGVRRLVALVRDGDKLVAEVRVERMLLDRQRFISAALDA